MRPNHEKVRQININRTMHAEQLDKKTKDQKSSVDVANSIVVKKESKWSKFRKFILRKSSNKNK